MKNIYRITTLALIAGSLTALAFGLWIPAVILSASATVNVVLNG